MLDKAPSDKLIKNSLKRTTANNEMEEAGDMAVQEQMTQMAQMLNQVEGFLYGGKIDPVSGETETPVVNMEQSDIGTLPGETTEGWNPLGTMSGGDVLGLIGNFQGMNSMKKNTANSRATDTPNVNAYKDFGKDGMDALDGAEDNLKQSNDTLFNEIRQNAGASKRNNRVGARGMASQRAADLAVDQGVNDTMGKASAQFAQQMMQLMSQKSQAENMQDRFVMQGEDSRDMKDRADKDAHYTNKAQDIASSAQGMQQMGKDVNAVQQNELIMKMLSQMSNYFNMDSKGNIANRPKTD
jgi:hypothetical protein